MNEQNHREREKGVLVYPVYSRRAGGLSIGINLFPDKKRCSFDCPYCEVFPFSSNAVFSLKQMEEDLRAAIAMALQRKTPVMDICFSGNGESTLSPAFPAALELTGRIRDEMVNTADLVLITNGSGLMDTELFSLLRDAASGPLRLNIWQKLDAGTPQWYNKINRPSILFEKITAKIKEFAACAPLTIQTMLCTVDGEAPPPEEKQAWEKLILELILRKAEETGGGVRKVQIYGKARPAPEDPKAAMLPVKYLNERSDSLRSALAEAGCAKGVQPPVEVYP